MKNIIITALVLIGMTICFVGGFAAGIRKATTSDGWIEGHEFVLSIDGNIFAWEIEKEQKYYASNRQTDSYLSILQRIGCVTSK